MFGEGEFCHAGGGEECLSGLCFGYVGFGCEVGDGVVGVSVFGCDFEGEVKSLVGVEGGEVVTDGGGGVGESFDGDLGDAGGGVGWFLGGRHG